jgi:uncharacterized Zn finger protein (UPF0148 family)
MRQVKRRLEPVGRCVSCEAFIFRFTAGRLRCAVCGAEESAEG